MVRLYAEPLVYCMGSIPDSSAVREESGTLLSHNYSVPTFVAAIDW